MVFLILNAAIAVILIFSSFAIIDTWAKKKNTDQLINNILFLASLFVLMALMIVLCLYGPMKVSLFVGKIAFFVMGCFCTHLCTYMLIFPASKRGKISKSVELVLDVIAFLILFVVKGGITNISITNTNFFQLTSNLMFHGKLGRTLMLTWFSFYENVYVFAVPAFTSIMVLVKAEHTVDTLAKQKLRILVGGVISSFIIYLFITFSSIYQPMIRSLLFVSFIPEVLIFMNAEETDDILDIRMALQELLSFTVKYFMPAVLIGLFLTICWSLHDTMPILFYVLVTIEIVVLLALWYFAGKHIAKKGLIRDRRYAADFANAIASLNFEDEPSVITSNLFEIFKTYVDSSSMKIAIDSGDNYLKYAYSSDPEYVERGFEVNTEVFDHLLNINRLVVFREFAETDYTVAAIKTSLLKLFDETKSDAIILITEGRHMSGIIALGKKISNNVYNEYDYNVFSNMYSDLFVVGYYMKNILNESVVGTVNREIQMSSQIITSIQENMDKIKNEKVDSGYLMIPAHNIGGEFVDIIRLTDTRYIYIIGSLSGKGIAASMNMVILKSIIRTFLAETSDFKILVHKVNSFIRESLPKGTIFYGIFGLVDFSTDTMYYINCGAPALFLYTRAYNNIIEIQGDGHVLGFAKDMTDLIKVKKVKLSPGDIVFACTDGVLMTKSLRGDEYGKGRVENEIMENKTFSSSKIAKFIYDGVARFASAELEDDVTIFMMKYINPKEGESK